jgi:hypothetical protein
VKGRSRTDSAIEFDFQMDDNRGRRILFGSDRVFLELALAGASSATS